MVCFAKALVVHDLPLPQEFDGFGNVRVVGKAQDVVIAQTGFLLRRKILVQVRDGVAGDGKGSRREGRAGGSLGIDAGGMVHEVIRKARLFYLLGGQAAGKLIDDGADHFQVGQLFGALRSTGNVPFALFGGEHDTVGFAIHSFSTFERVRKYGEGESAGTPYSIRISEVERRINICGVASKKCEIVEWKPYATGWTS
jgi:hypothetical protein